MEKTEVSTIDVTVEVRIGSPGLRNDKPGSDSRHLTFVFRVGVGVRWIPVACLVVQGVIGDRRRIITSTYTVHSLRDRHPLDRIKRHRKVYLLPFLYLGPLEVKPSYLHTW